MVVSDSNQFQETTMHEYNRRLMAIRVPRYHDWWLEVVKSLVLFAIKDFFFFRMIYCATASSSVWKVTRHVACFILFNVWYAVTIWRCVEIHWDNVFTLRLLIYFWVYSVKNWSVKLYQLLIIPNLLSLTLLGTVLTFMWRLLGEHLNN
jgi:hypothetical protein